YDTGVKLVSTGGSIDRELNALLGALTADFISRVRFTKVFISAAGCNFPDGISTTSDFILSVIRSALKSGKERYCLIDSTKFERECPFRIAPLSSFNAIITDNGIKQEFARKIREAGGHLVICGNKDYAHKGVN
ncbi:MAG: DeoR/GlpR transcriptional regulator, partial [Clostridia bacterium]|nr:DeoR/GlpR transcriptional regulator [Clostridia bacterium]